MGKRLYIGNLSYGLSDRDLSQLFEPHGTVASAQIVTDRETGRSRGFGFVEMETEQQAQAAIDALNGKESAGRTLAVNEARPRPDRPDRARGTSRPTGAGWRGSGAAGGGWGGGNRRY